MNHLRRTIFFLLAIFVFAGAYEASASHFGITYTSTLNITAGLNPSGVPDFAFNLSFNLTNISDTTPDALDMFNITNVTIFAILPNGTEVELARNNTIDDFLIAGYGDGGFSYEFDRELIINASLFPPGQGDTPNQEGDIALNITVDVFNGTNTTVVFNESITFLSYVIFVDNTPPSISIKFLDKSDNEQTSFQATDKVKIVCTRSSETANSATTATSLVPSFNDTNMSIQPADSSSFDGLEADTTRATASTEFTIEFTNTLELGDYTVACYSIDDLGGINDTVNKTFTIVKKPHKSTSAFTKSPEGQKIVTGVENLGTVTAQGTSRLMKKGSSVRVDVNGEAHTITVASLSPAAVTLTIESTPQEVTLNKGETKEVDVDGDGQNDLALTFHQQFKSGSRATADITLKAIATPAEPKKDTTKQPGSSEDKEVSGSSSGMAIVTIIVIIAIIVIGFALIRGKKR